MCRLDLVADMKYSAMQLSKHTKSIVKCANINASIAILFPQIFEAANFVMPSSSALAAILRFSESF